MSELSIEYGSVQFRSENQLTIEEVANLAKAAKIAGIPANAIVTNIHFDWRNGYPNNHVSLNISWRMPEQLQ